VNAGAAALRHGIKVRSRELVGGSIWRKLSILESNSSKIFFNTIMLTACGIIFR
jgi:hypothetical protein